jgi:hypothetical protein
MVSAGNRCAGILVTGIKNPTDDLFSELVLPRYMNWTARNFIRQAGCRLGIVFKKGIN